MHSSALYNIRYGDSGELRQSMSMDVSNECGQLSRGLPAFSFGILRLNYQQYISVVACVMGLYLSLIVFEYYQGHRDFVIQYELFLFVLYGILLTWFAFFGAYLFKIRSRLRQQNRRIRQAQIEKDKLIVELKEALKKVKTLSGLQG